jgi:hypothetical protein
MTHVEQHYENQTSNGLGIAMDKAEIKHKERRPMDRVHRGTGRARSTILEEILIMYVKGRIPFTQIVETAPSQVSTPNKFPSHAYISSPPNHLSQQAHLRFWFDVGQVTSWDAGPSDLQPTRAHPGLDAFST